MNLLCSYLHRWSLLELDNFLQLKNNFQIMVIMTPPESTFGADLLKHVTMTQTWNTENSMLHLRIICPDSNHMCLGFEIIW